MRVRAAEAPWRPSTVRLRGKPRQRRVALSRSAPSRISFRASVENGIRSRKDADEAFHFGSPLLNGPGAPAPSILRAATRATQPFIAVAQNHAVVVLAQESLGKLFSKAPESVRP